MSARRIFNKLQQLGQRVFRHLWTIRYSCVNDPQKILDLEVDKYRSLGLDYSSGITKLKEIQGAELDLESISSHLVLFASLSAAQNSIRDILEIGTFKGETTNLLARLFPTARITTVDLPVSDPIFSESYRGARGTTAAKKTYETVLRQNVSPENVTFIESNTVFLLSTVSQQFDLIWLDGGHKYPEVAWDACQAYWLCRPGGLIVFDDVIMHRRPVTTEKISGASYEVLRYIEQRASCKVTHLLKRLAPEYNSIEAQKKYISVLQKSTKPQENEK